MELDVEDFDLTDTVPLDMETTFEDEGIVLKAESASKEEKSNTFGIIVSELLIATISVGIVVYISNKNKKEILDAIKYGKKSN